MRLRRRNHHPGAVFVTQILGSGVQHQRHQIVFLRSLLGIDGNLAFAFKHPSHATLLTHVAAVFGERMTHFTHRTVAIIGSRVHQHRRAAGTIAFVHNFVNLSALQFTRAPHDGALDVIGRHTDGLRFGDGGAQAGVAVCIAPTARGNHDFFDDLGELLPALGVGSGFLVLNRRPFGVAGHLQPRCF